MAHVPPKVANAQAQATLDLVADTTNDPMVRVTRASKRCKTAESLLAVGSISETEYAQHETFQAHCIATATGGAAGVGAPAWFGPAVAAALAAALAPVNARLTSIEGRMTNIEARQANVVASDSEDLLQPLINAAGVPFPNFPGTYGDLLNMNDNEMSAFLAHYGLVPVDDDDKTLKRHQIKKFIGMRIG